MRPLLLELREIPFVGFLMIQPTIVPKRTRPAQAKVAHAIGLVWSLGDFPPLRCLEYFPLWEAFGLSPLFVADVIPPRGAS